MAEDRLIRQMVAHPIRKKPYNAIKFARVNPAGVILYTVAKEKKEMGAKAALKAAFETFGGHCFHCGQWMPPQKLSHSCTRDHLTPKADGGADMLHNLVLACGPCNKRKGRKDLIDFHSERGSEYLRALETHLTRSIKAIGPPKPGA